MDYDWTVERINVDPESVQLNDPSKREALVDAALAIAGLGPDMEATVRGCLKHGFYIVDQPPFVENGILYGMRYEAEIEASPSNLRIPQVVRCVLGLEPSDDNLR